jgi:hypothetical protein
MEKKEPTGDGEGGGRPHAHGEGRDGGVGPRVKKSGGGSGRERRWSCSGLGKRFLADYAVRISEEVSAAVGSVAALG